MLIASLLINVIVLAPICFAIITRKKEMDRAFGIDTTARQILLCMYMALLGLSFWLLYFKDLKVAAAVLSFQVIYKFLSAVFIRDRRTPVLWFNIAIAVFHTATLYVLFWEVR